ncbi:MAG: homoserine O-succinyltransferase [Lachnospiraceae bacterium]|jgi:homoserine O-succinyltransferase|nr:homoserine O-succinyltransferase [Lachnospiraceae bacterium]
MPICTTKDLPVRSVLEKENIFVMDEDRALHQDIRPISIGILNIMPLKEDTELMLLRSLSNTPLQVDVTFLTVKDHDFKNASMSHLYKFYQTIEDIKDQYLDGLIITGAPVETMEFEQVDYWDEMTRILEWTKTHVTSTFHICWGAQAGLYYHYGIKKHMLPEKLFGVYSHKVLHRKVPLVRGFDDLYLAPHSRNTTVLTEDVEKHDDLIILSESPEAGIFLCMNEDGSQIFCMGHPEYDRYTLDKEYKRDIAKGMDIALPKNYYIDDDPNKKPKLQWRGHANTLYTNWINYYVYQATPYIFLGKPRN